MKKKMIITAVVLIVLVVGFLAYYHYVPFMVSIVTTFAFIAGGVLGYWIRGRKEAEDEAES